MTLYDAFIRVMFGRRDESRDCPGCGKYDPANLINPCCSSEALARANNPERSDTSWET